MIEIVAFYKTAYDDFNEWEKHIKNFSKNKRTHKRHF